MTDDVVATVSEWHADEGWGRVTVVDSGDEAWTHFSAIEGRPSGSLRVGEEIRLWYHQPGSAPGEFQAIRVVPLSDDDPNATPAQPSGDAYRSDLTVAYDPE